jgi:hypothetical protein
MGGRFAATGDLPENARLDSMNVLAGSLHPAIRPRVMRGIAERTGLGSHTVLWVIAVLLGFMAGMLWTHPVGQLAPTALAQSPPLVGARGIYAFTGQLDHNRYGLFMLDIEQGTIWCYEIDNVGGVRKLRLTAARSWIYDRYLRDFNCADPDFRTVQQLVAQQRAMPRPATDTAGDESDRHDELTPADGAPGEP